MRTIGSKARLGAAAMVLLASNLAWSGAARAELSQADLVRRLRVVGEIYVLDATGTKLEYVATAHDPWHVDRTGTIDSNWGESDNHIGHVVLHHRWTPQADGSVKVLVEEYAEDSTPTNPKPRQLLKRQETTLANFAPIVWRSEHIKDKNVVVRLIPSLTPEPPAIDVGKLPLASRKVTIADNHGFLWTDHAVFDEQFVGFKTHRGTVAISYQPFTGAKPLGYAQGNRIDLELAPDLKLALTSSDAFLPDGVRAQVYGLYAADKREANPQSLLTFSSSTVDRFNDHLRQELHPAAP